MRKGSNINCGLRGFPSSANYIISTAKANPRTALLVTGGAMLLGYFLVVRPIFKKLGLVKSDSQVEQESLSELYTHQVSEVPSFPLIKYKEMADVIEDSLGSYLVNDNEDLVYSQFLQLRNNRDLAELIRAFGMRSRTITFFGTGKKGLSAFLNNAMNRSEVGKINQILSDKGINYRF